MGPTAASPALRPATSPSAPLALTMGDPAGIGPEITLKAWHARKDRSLPTFALFADPGALEDAARRLSLSVRVETISVPNEAHRVFGTALPVIPIRLAAKPIPGRAESANSAAVLSSITGAVSAVQHGEASAVVTNPIAKSVLYAAGFMHPGHTEFLAELSRTIPGASIPSPVMLLASDELKVVPLTIHIPLIDVPKRITKSLIFETVRTLWQSLKTDFGIAAPRIAVAGLNPHAGESGTIGEEDVRVIAPAIEELRAEGLAVTGPHSADTLFHASARRGYDAVVAMYHDQALIPIKTLAFDKGVNVTLGLPFVRTSPDHGTAFDIAGKGIANAESLIEALKLANLMAERRAVAAVASL